MSNPPGTTPAMAIPSSSNFPPGTLFTTGPGGAPVALVPNMPPPMTTMGPVQYVSPSELAAAMQPAPNPPMPVIATVMTKDKIRKRAEQEYEYSTYTCGV